jgi:S1-C subfamily serine protease
VLAAIPTLWPSFNLKTFKAIVQGAYRGEKGREEAMKSHRSTTTKIAKVLGMVLIVRARDAAFVSAMILVLTLSCTSISFAAGPLGNIHVGFWKGGAYTNDSTGAFTHCAAAGDFSNGVGVVLAQHANRTWQIGFASKSWTLQPGETRPIDLTFDGQASFRVFGNAVTANLISAPLPEAAAKRFQRSHMMVASGTSTFQFNLGSVEKLIPSISNCVDKVNAGGISNAGDFSIAAAKPPVIPTAATTKEPAPQPANAPKLVNVNGTGFVISTNGYVLTNDHVISRCVGDVRGNLSGESANNLRVVSKDETNDLALLQTAGNLKEFARIRTTAVRSGDSVIAIGYPFHGLLTSDFTVTTGIVNSLSGILNDTRFLQISAPIQPGNSGGPLLDTSGNVIGVVAEKLNALKFAKLVGELPENINFAIKTGAVRDFLDNSVVPYQMADASSELKTAQIAEGARAYTMLISCSATADETAGK